MALAAGQIIDGKYRIVRTLGVGGMGEVYEGENTRIHRKVAIKVLHAEVAQKADIVQRFEREAQAAGRIGSEHIVEVLDLGSLPGGERYLVMEFLDGEPLTSRIKLRGRLPPQDIAYLLRQLLEGLGAAHQAGIVHRDLKPDNVYVVKRGGYDFVKILDFGVSKFTSSNEELSMTKTGAVMGTPYYMSPEQARGQPIDHRSDLYAIGVVAYQAATGRVPFDAETFNELLFKIALETPEPIERVVPGIDVGFASIVRKAMERDQNHRFQSAREFAHALDTWRAGAGPQRAQFLNEPTFTGGYPSQFANEQSHGSGQFSQSQAMQRQAMAQSGGSLGQSGTGQVALRQSGANGQPLGTSHAQVAAHPLGVSGTSAPRPHPGAQAPLGQSQVGLAVTAGQPKKSASLMIAIGAMVALGVGGGVALFVFQGSGSTPAAAKTAEASEPTATATATASTAPSETPTAKATAEPPPTATEVTASATTSAEPTATATATASSKPVAVTPRTGPGPQPPPPKTSTPTATPKPPPTGGGGRPIDGNL